MIDRIIHNQVDLILFEEGRFSTLSWLLREGHLDYSDYQKWLSDAIDYLDNHFKTPRNTIFSDLKKVQDYAGKLKLESHHQVFKSLTDQKLHFSHCPEHELIYTTIFEPQKNRLQMDLFFDSSPACTMADLAKAIINKNQNDCALLLKRLHAIDPQQFRRFEQLLSYQKELASTTADTNFKIALLEDKLSPLTFQLFGAIAQDYLVSLWRILSDELVELNFNADRPKCHLSYTAFKGFQWQQVLDSIERETDWQKQPVLLFRYAEACFKLHDELQGLENWFRLFIFFSDSAVQFIGNTCHRLLSNDWLDFQTLEPALQDIFFPTWVLLKKPPLAKYSFAFPDHSPGVAAFQLVRKIVSDSDSGLSESDVQLRILLKQQYPEIFTHLLDTIEKKEKLKN